MPALDDALSAEPSGASRGALRVSGSCDASSFDDELDDIDTAGIPELEAPGEYGSFFTERSLGGAYGDSSGAGSSASGFHEPDSDVDGGS